METDKLRTYNPDEAPRSEGTHQDWIRAVQERDAPVVTRQLRRKRGGY